MKKAKATSFQFAPLLSFCLLIILIAAACSAPFPNAVYDVSNRRLSHYENNYFIRLLPRYRPYQSHQNHSPDLYEPVNLIPDNNGTFIFSKEDQLVVGFFRIEKEVEPATWFQLMDMAETEKSFDGENSLLEEIFSPFDAFDFESGKVQLNTYNNYLRVDSSASSEKIRFKFAIKPYATRKGGTRNSLFVAYMFYLPSVSEDIAQKDFEALLENTVLSYFLNYERKMTKKLSFN
ncbi:MAG: hypothetical protein HQM13_16340 [SAR324 cluster bacterium]|nr:hypothetical protein [SAR324 cluster bacterium]